MAAAAAQDRMGTRPTENKTSIYPTIPTIVHQCPQNRHLQRTIRAGAHPQWPFCSKVPSWRVPSAVNRGFCRQVASLPHLLPLDQRTAAAREAIAALMSRRDRGGAEISIYISHLGLNVQITYRDCLHTAIVSRVMIVPICR